MLQSVLAAFYDAVAMLLRHQVEKRSILENLDLVVLALDETIDNGFVLSLSLSLLHLSHSPPFRSRSTLMTHLHSGSSSKPTLSRSHHESRDRNPMRESNCPTLLSTSRPSCRQVISS